MFKTNNIKNFLGTTKFKGHKILGLLHTNAPIPMATGLMLDIYSSYLIGKLLILSFYELLNETFL